jgi:hypothetical protein
MSSPQKRAKKARLVKQQTEEVDSDTAADKMSRHKKRKRKRGGDKRKGRFDSPLYEDNGGPFRYTGVMLLLHLIIPFMIGSRCYVSV